MQVDYGINKQYLMKFLIELNIKINYYIRIVTLNINLGNHIALLQKSLTQIADKNYYHVRSFSYYWKSVRNW